MNQSHPRAQFPLSALLCAAVLAALPSLVQAAPPATSRAGRGPQVAVDQVVGPASPLQLPERIGAIGQLSNQLSPAEAGQIVAYLQSVPPAEQTGEERQLEYWFRNDLLNKLLAQRTLPPDLATVLIGIHQDRRQPTVLRDYALQFFSLLSPRVAANDQAALRNCLWKAVTEKDSQIAGTALIALRDLSRTEPALANQIGRRALQLVRDPDCSDLTRITALQICAELAGPEALPEIERWARAQASAPVRISAIAALGQLGGPTARATLDELSREPDARVRAATAAAQRRLQP